MRSLSIPRYAMQGMVILVRPRAWWYNKVPLSIFLLLLLLDGRPFTSAALAALLGLVGTVCCVANYGYGLNELFDRDEDRRAGRSNATETTGNRGMWAIIVLSATSAVGLATASGGLAGFALTAGELLIPLAYSVPPLRLKERGWAGVLADALAAHVFPAALAMEIVFYQSLRTPNAFLIVVVAAWSLATGLRGILSHQLQSEESDRRAGLSTVIHRLGHHRIESLVVFVILPMELLSCSIAFLHAHGTVFLMTVAVIFVFYEYLKFRLDAFPVIVFTPKGQKYLPFVDEAFYKVWGPFALAIDTVFADLRFLPLAPLYVLLFRPRVQQEVKQICETTKIVSFHIDNFVARLRG